MIVPGKIIIRVQEDNNYTKVNGFNCFDFVFIAFKVCQKTRRNHFVQLSAVMLRKHFKIQDKHFHLCLCVNVVKTYYNRQFCFSTLLTQSLYNYFPFYLRLNESDRERHAAIDFLYTGEKEEQIILANNIVPTLFRRYQM